MSSSYNSSDSASSSIFIRLLSRLLDFLKSLSFLRASSQEEPLASPNDIKAENLQKAMQLLTKAAEANNAEAAYLLGELNFVIIPRSNLMLITSMETILKQIIEKRLIGSINLLRLGIWLQCIYWDLCMRLELEMQLNLIKELYSHHTTRAESTYSLGIVISYFCSIRRKYTIRNDGCISPSHGNWDAS